ncbi:MAG: hypothetical protein LBO74_08425 [Candidatus Symbiothrix sp.]|jgi:hypothetical protein|nr:hypothetical protein [Candidatus Symbiothrix sp.]
MKKILVLALFAVLFVGCSNEDDVAKNNNGELVGSCWSETINQYQTYTFYFAINEKCTMVWGTGMGDVSMDYKFSYNKPNIVIKNPINGSTKYSGYIKDDIMYLTERGDAPESFELIKIR